MSELENELGLANWLSIISFDLHKYIKAGGELIISSDENGLIVQFAGVATDDNRLHRKFIQSVKTENEDLAQ